MASELLEFLWGKELDSGSPSLQVSHSFSPPPTYVEGAAGVPFLQLGVCEGSGTSRRSGQDAGERCLGAGRSLAIPVGDAI